MTGDRFRVRLVKRHGGVTLENLDAQLVSDIATIKWILVLLLLVVGSAFIGFLRVMGQLSGMAEMGKKRAEHQRFQTLCEELLMRGSYDSVKETAKNRISSYPDDVYAHWYLAQAFFKKGEFPAARRRFDQVLELDPVWEFRVTPWQERVEEEIQNSGPTVVR